MPKYQSSIENIDAKPGLAKQSLPVLMFAAVSSFSALPPGNLIEMFELKPYSLMKSGGTATSSQSDSMKKQRAKDFEEFILKLVNESKPLEEQFANVLSSRLLDLLM